MKAFLVTRVGDVGFLLGIALLGLTAGSFRIADVLAYDFGLGTATAAGLLLLAGVAGKSAQFPLHTWLPDAMAGPTPISALIHAATMVAAGIYAVIRLFPLFERAPVTLAVLGVLGSVTLLLGAFAATAQDDLKRILAWSTVSQIGYMAGALAVGSPAAALFHLLSHAAFKALLFLAAGCVIHAVGSNLISAMGGLRRAMPVTFVATLIGLGALAGVPPLAGFWSKDGILVVAQQAGRHGAGPAAAWVGQLVWLAGLIGVLVTAGYATRLLLLVFFGTPRPDPARTAARPAGRHALAGAAAGGAERAARPGRLQRPVPPRPRPRRGAPGRASCCCRWPCSCSARRVTWWRWRRDPAADPATALGPLRPAFANAFWLDAVQHTLVVRPVRALARLDPTSR